MRWCAIGWLAVWACMAGMAQEAGPRGPIRTLVVDGKTLRYKVSGGLAITEGDIVLGNATDIEAYAGGNSKSLPREAALYLGGLGTPNLWPQGTMYYTISGVPNPQRILDAVAHWNAKTPLKILPWTGQTNYVRFIISSDGGCSSTIGMVGGQQTIQLGAGCPAAAVIHEIGHTFGLMHEQSRRDRDRWLTVLYENIDDYDYDQFHQDPNERDLSYYDYGSIMHYGPDGFSVDGGTALETVPPGIPIGQRVGLSAGDIDAISRVYSFIPTQTTVTTIPEGLTIVVDGQRVVAPQAFNWTPGSQHTLSVDATQQGISTRNVFVRWTDGGTQSHTFTASADQTAIAAEFQQYFQVTTGVNVGNGTVTVSPASADGYYLAGTNVKVTAKAGAGQALYTWRGTEVQNYGFGYSADVLTIPVREAVTFTADFRSAAAMTLVDANPSGAEVVVDNSTYVTPVRFINGWTQGSTHTLAPSTPQYSPTSSSKLVFTQWEDGSNLSTRSIQVGATAATYTATYKLQHFLNYDWTGSGTVTANPGGSAYYDAGTNVTVTALPRFNSRLQYWLGSGIGGGSLNQTVVMDRPRYAFAIFGSALDFRPTNAASYSSNIAFDQAGTNVAPLEIVTLFGTGLGPSTLATGVLDSNGRFASTLSGTRILFDGIAAPIIYASETQTAVVVPAEVASRTFTVISAERNGTVVGITTASVIPSLPGIFTSNASGTGQIAAFNEDFSLNSSTHPAPPGSVVTVYATGAGLMDRTLINGAIMDGNLARPQLPVYVRIGTEPAVVEYAGSAPTLVNGALQVNVRIPATAQSGNQPIKLIVGTAASAPGTTIAIR